ncbi:MAG: peptidoglycan DD-metalloendopeptidase family protein [Pseudomonadales bacterium]
MFNWLTVRFPCFLFLVCLTIFLQGCQSNGARAPVSNIGERGKAHVVQKGETLYAIAWRYGLDYQRLARLNRIRAPYTIFAGQRLKISGVPKRSSQSKSEKSSPGAPRPQPKVYTKKPTAPPAKAFTPSQLVWQWPVSGPVLEKFSLSGRVNKGIDVKAKAGSEVRAAAGGTIVYAGGNLRGYGKLVIIKHDEAFLSAYGNNQALRVKEGQRVEQGEVIAVVGANDANVEMLHFEIRREGRPEDPLKHLPKR